MSSSNCKFISLLNLDLREYGVPRRRHAKWVWRYCPDSRISSLLHPYVISAPILKFIVSILSEPSARDIYNRIIWELYADYVRGLWWRVSSPRRGVKGALIVIGEASAGPGFAREVRISLVVLSLVFAVELVVTVLTLIRLVGLVGS